VTDATGFAGVHTITIPASATAVTKTFQISTAGSWTMLMFNALDNGYNLVGGTAGTFNIAPGVVTTFAFNFNNCGLTSVTFPNFSSNSAGTAASIAIPTQTFDQFSNKSSLQPTGYAATTAVTVTGFSGTPTANVNLPLGSGAVTVNFATMTTPLPASGNVGAGTIALNNAFLTVTQTSNTFNILVPGNLNVAPNFVTDNVGGMKFTSSILNTVSNDSIMDGGTATNGNKQNEVTVQLTDASGTPISVSVADRNLHPVPSVAITLGAKPGTGIGTGGAAQSGNFNALASLITLSTDDFGQAHFLQASEPFSCDGLVLLATSGSLNPACSNAFDILPGPADSNPNPAAFTVTPAGTTPQWTLNGQFAAAGNSGTISPTNATATNG